MSNLRGASGANKSRLHNVNSVYSGKNTAATKASGPGKHGLQPLGKATAVVRRMPPPATLPSLKAEHGQDPTIAIVPQGGTGWTKSSTDAEINKQNGSSDITGANASNDLRPTWAKNSTTPNTSTTQTMSESPNTAALSTLTTYSNNSQQSQGTAAQIVAGQSAAPPNNRDFPSLAASVAAVSGSKSDTGSLKPQKASAWGTNLADANVEIPPIPIVSSQQNQSGGYIGASTAPKPHVDRKLPERYFSSQPPVTQSRVAGKIGIREKLARLSMESKEPSVDAEQAKVAAEQQASELAKPSTTEPPKEVHVAPQQQQQAPPTPTAPMNQQFSQPPPQLRSQDVRQLQPSQFSIPDSQPQPTSEWQSQERFVNGGGPPYNYDQQQQKLLQNGRGEGGYGGPRNMQQQPHGNYHGGGFVGQQRFDERGNLYGERQIEELGWGDDLSNDNRRGMVNNQSNRNNRYRIDSRSSTEADNNTWQGPPQHYGQQQQQQNGPRQQQIPQQNAGWYDNSGYPLVAGQDYTTPPPQPTQYPPGNNFNNQRSRNSSVATDYNNYEQQPQQQKGGPPRRHPDFDYRQQGYQGYPSGGNNYHEMPPPQQQQHSHDNQQQQRNNIPQSNRQQQNQQHQQQQRYQQPDMPYRVLKRNDEKSAEYIAHHGGGPILQHQQQSSGEEEAKSSKSKENKQRKAENDKPSEAGKAPIPEAPKENVWEKRMEERKKEERSKPNNRFQQELDYNFPSINDAPKDINEWNPPPPIVSAPVASSSEMSSNKNSRKGQNRNENQYSRDQQKSQQQRAPPSNVAEATSPVDTESIGATHWVQQQTGPSWDNLSIPADNRPEEPFEEDDVYTGTKREFVNSKRTRGGQFNKPSGDYASRDIRQPRRGGAGDSVSSAAINGKKPSASQPKPQGFDPTTKRSSRTEDNFSNMGEFHADDFKIPEEATAAATTKRPHRQRDTFDNVETFDSSRRGSKRGAPRISRGNNNWKGSDRPQRNHTESLPREAGTEESFEPRHDTVNSRGNGRRLAPMGGNARGSSSRFLSKHTSKPTRHKYYEGTVAANNISRTNRASSDRANVEGLKSPAASEGVDEWETASESSDVGGREEQQQPQDQKPLANGIRAQGKHQHPKESSDTNSISSNSKETSQADEIISTKSSGAATSASRSHQKNVKPVSHIFPDKDVFVKSSNAYSNKNNCNNQQLQPNNYNSKHRMQNTDTSKSENAREIRKGFGNSNSSSTHMGLAGLDINDASVIVIDNQPDISRDESYSESGDFEEVLSKKQKKQRQIQVEEERRKEQKEKEKAEKIQAKKNKALQKRNEIKNSRKSQEKAEVSVPEVVESKKKNVPSTTSLISKNVDHDLGTSVWNSTLIASNPTTIVEKQPHIPSPIARPIKPPTFSNSTSANVISPPLITPAAVASSSLTIDVNAVKEDFDKFTIATSTVSTATTSACYDFAYDASLKSASPIGVNSSPKSEVKKLSTDSDHVQLKEKLDKVKDFWPGQADFDSAIVENGHIDKNSLSQAHGPNVAKVKPQPQLHDQQHHQPQQPSFPQAAPEVKAKQNEPFNVFAIPPSQSPNIYQPRGGNTTTVFTMGPTSPFRQVSSNPIYPMTFGSNDFIQHYGGSHANSPPNQTFYGGQVSQHHQSQPPRPQSFDGFLNSNQLWSNGIDILSTITPPLQQTQQQQQNQQRYNSNSRPPSHPSIMSMPNGFPPTHLPPPPSMGYQSSSNNYIPTHIPPPSMPPHQYIEMMNGSIQAPRNNSRPMVQQQQPPSQSHQQNYRPPMQILRPQFNGGGYAPPNGISMAPPQFHPQQQAAIIRQNHPQRVQQQQQQNWHQKQPHDQHLHQQHQQLQHHSMPPSNQQQQPQQTSNYGGFFNINKFSTNQSTA